MSGGLRVGLPFARECALQVCARLGIDPVGIMGSIRRGCASVGDIDLVAPLPAPGARDVLFGAIVQNFQAADKPGFLPRPLIAGAMGRIEKGDAAGFKYCGLIGTFGDIELKVQIHRYVDGPRGNRGWIEIMRTGPEEYSHGFLSRWKSVQRIQMVNQGSVGGFLVDCRGVVVPTPTEESAFEAAGLRFVAPGQRGKTGVVGSSLSPPAA